MLSQKFLLDAQDWTKSTAVVGIARIVVEIECTRISGIAIVAPTNEEWIARVRKVRVVQFNP